MAYLDKIAQNNPHKPIISRYNMQSARIIHFCIQQKAASKSTKKMVVHPNFIIQGATDLHLVFIYISAVQLLF